MEELSLAEGEKMFGDYIKLALFIPWLISVASVPVIGEWALIPFAVFTTCIEIVNCACKGVSDE